MRANFAQLFKEVHSLRYISIDSLEPNMILGKNIYNKNNDILLSKNSVLNDTIITRIKELGYQGVYVEDNLSKDIVIDPVISEELRIDAIKKIKKAFVSYYIQDFDEDSISISDIVEEIVDEILSHPEIIINLIDLRAYDNYTYYHSVNVSIISIIIGTCLKLSRDDLRQLGIAGILHDIGKEFLPHDMLTKQTPLSHEEFEIIKTHPYLGYSHLKRLDGFSQTICSAILQHHERFDGNGYPMRKRRYDISLFGRIISIADVYDALISKRPYHDPYLPSDALEFILGASGTAFDPALVEIFMKKISIYPLGITVKLSDGRKGIVIKNYENYPTRPLIRMLDTNEEINLKDDNDALNLTIVSSSYKSTPENEQQYSNI